MVRSAQAINGGLDLAVEEVTGGKTAWVSDIDPGACTILEHRFPDAPNIGDMTALDWNEVPPVDVLCGGTPCQDLSAAGRRAGMKEGTRSNLWVQMREAIETLQPRLVVWENVKGALSARATSELESIEGRVGGGSDGPVLRALGRVLGDLSEIGFDAEWTTIRASDVGAPHGRARVFLLAWPTGTSPHSLCGGSGGGSVESVCGEEGGADAAADGADHRHVSPRDAGDVTLLPTPNAYDGKKGGSQHPEKRRAGGHQPTVADAIEHLLPTPSAYAGSRGGSQHPSKLRAAGHSVHVADVAEHLLPTPKAGGADFGSYAPAVRRWEQVTGNPAPAPTKPSPRTGKPQLSAEFVEFLMGLPNGWFTDPELGLSRVQQLQLGGNGVVPQQAAYAVRGLLARAESLGVAA